MRKAIAFLVAAGTSVVQAAGANMAVELPRGETALADMGLYRVGWQSYGAEPVYMPLSWTGHFEPRSGVSFTKWGRVLGREALLLHSPWMAPVGKAWVEYELALPPEKPIRLAFGIAMSPEAVGKDKSDGVTFICAVRSGNEEHELLRRNHDKAEWADCDFDLSEHAGKTITLRLEVEPGPSRNPAFDFSVFGDAKITVGEGGPKPDGLLERLCGTAAYKAAAKANRSVLSNTARNGVAPSSLFKHRNSLERAGRSWRFVCQGEDCRVVYTYAPGTGTLDDFTAQVDKGLEFFPALGGGATVTARQSQTNQGGARPMQTVFASGGKPLELVRDGESLKVLWEYGHAAQPLRIEWNFRMIGKALAVSARGDRPVVSGFSLGEVAAAFRKTINVPYLSGHVSYLPAQGVFICRYLDWTRSHASMCPQGTATYDAKTDGTRNTLLESGYIAVSPDVDEVLPNIPQPQSPHLALLGPRIMLDVWGHHRNSFAGDAANLRALKDHGVDHLAIIQHVWQRFGYDVKLPDHIPADPRYGGDEGMIEFGRAANECGYVWSLHENYIDLYPDAPSYDPAARVLMADGTPSKAWYNPGTRVQSFGLKCNRALGYAKQNSIAAHKRYQTTAAYLDVHTCVPPWHQLDHEAGQPMAAMALAKVKSDTELFQFERDTHQGPLLGEGANHFYWAGQCDGVEAQVIGGEDHAPFLDFDLLKLHSQMVNHGMGYYERWYRRGYEARWGVDAGSVSSLDKYRAQELAYGHAGFIGAMLVNNVQAVLREHHLMHSVQRLYGTARPVEILYEVQGRFVTASAALVAGDTLRQRIRYDSGLTLWINWRPEPWAVENRVLPQWGWLALGPKTEASSSLRAGRWADYAECPEFVFADARTSFDLPYLRPGKDTETDWTAHINPPGTWIDFGKVATDGSIKVNREKDRLVVFPYPRDKRFRASLDLKALAPGADLGRTQVRALAASTGADLGTDESAVDGGRLSMTFGVSGAGRYVITWR